MIRTRRCLMVPALLGALVLGSGCSERDPGELAPARGNRDGVVFDDGEGWGSEVYFQPFSDTYYTAVSVDSVYAYGGNASDGARSLKIAIPPAGSALGAYSGGVFTPPGGRDLMDYTALTFYARTDSGSVARPLVRINEVGFGNDNTPTPQYWASRYELRLSPEWTFYVVPIPDPAKLLSERGLFLFAEGLQPEFRDGYNIWFDEVRFVDLSNVEVYRPTMDKVSRPYFVGSTVAITGTRTTFAVDGAPVTVYHSPRYLDFTSSDPNVATVRDGDVQVVAPGEATISATLQGIEVRNTVSVTVYEQPTVPAPAPTLPPDRVISMFSDAYVDVPVDTWNTHWVYSTTVLEDYEVAGNATKMYSALNFVGVEFLNPTINASGMTHFHVDVLAPAGTDFSVKLIAFPPDLEGSVETEELALDADSTPPFVAGGWSSLDIPLADFTLPEGWDWSAIGQLAFISSDAQLVLVDNVYWHD